MGSEAELLPYVDMGSNLVKNTISVQGTHDKGSGTRKRGAEKPQYEDRKQ
jgi:hypothetical protein